MAEPQEVQLHIMTNGDKETKPGEDHDTTCVPNQSTINSQKRYYRWLRIAIYTILVLLGQTSATLLGRLYFEKGGKSKWLGTLVQLVGFPILLPCYFIISSLEQPTTTTTTTTVLHHHHHHHHDAGSDNYKYQPPSAQILAFIYVSLGLLIVLNCYLYSVGLAYLPVSTMTLICSSGLGFNAFFSFFLNSLHFTPYIINSLVLLTISSILLVFQTDSEASDSSSHFPKGKYVIGFLCTLASSVGYGLLLSLSQLVFTKVLKRGTLKPILDLLVGESIVATCATLVGLFASGEWRSLRTEMEGYEMGKASYVMNLTWTSITWQLFSIGVVGLIFEVSSLFSNAISVVGLPMVPICAIIFFHDQMHGIKAISMVLAIWGFISYVYQQYLDDHKSNSSTAANENSSSSQEVNTQ